MYRKFYIQHTHTKFVDVSIKKTEKKPRKK